MAPPSCASREGPQFSQQQSLLRLSGYDINCGALLERAHRAHEHSRATLKRQAAQCLQMWTSHWHTVI